MLLKVPGNIGNPLPCREVAAEYIRISENFTVIAYLDLIRRSFSGFLYSIEINGRKLIKILRLGLEAPLRIQNVPVLPQKTLERSLWIFYVGST